jgi:hypothetical protein
VRLVVSPQLAATPTTFASVLANATLHQTDVDVDTVTVLFVVVRVAGEAALASVNDSGP